MVHLYSVRSLCWLAHKCAEIAVTTARREVPHLVIYQETLLLQDGVHLAMTPPLSNSSGGSHVVSALEELKNDPQKAQRMAKAGHRLVSDVLTSTNVQR